MISNWKLPGVVAVNSSSPTFVLFFGFVQTGEAVRTRGPLSLSSRQRLPSRRRSISSGFAVKHECTLCEDLVKTYTLFTSSPPQLLQLIRLQLLAGM